MDQELPRALGLGFRGFRGFRVTVGSISLCHTSRLLQVDYSERLDDFHNDSPFRRLPFWSS